MEIKRLEELIEKHKKDLAKAKERYLAFQIDGRDPVRFGDDVTWHERRIKQLLKELSFLR